MIRWGRVPGQSKAKAMGMTYTPEADNYKKLFREFMRTHFFVEIQKFRRHHEREKVYVLRLLFFFSPDQILNVTWPKGGKKRPKSPYKKMDVGNRRKLLEDCLSESIDIDDSLFFGVEQYKFVSDEPRVEMILEETDPNEFAIPPEYFR